MSFNKATGDKPKFLNQNKRVEGFKYPKKSVEAENSFSFVNLGSILLLLAGCVLQGYANKTIDTFFVGILLFVGGIVFVGLISPGKQPELQVFLLTFSIGVFVGGLAQIYSLLIFKNLQSTIDSFVFYGWISPHPPFTNMGNMRPIDAPLAILIWQQVYKLTWLLGFQFGPYTGVMFNAMIIGLSGFFTVKIAREIFGDDHWRLRRVGILFSLCGLFILFSSIFLRDSFLVFFNVLVLWGIVCWLVKQTKQSLIIAGALTIISAYATYFLRAETVYIFGIIWFLAFLLQLTKKKLKPYHLTILFFSLSLFILLMPYLSNIYQSGANVQTSTNERYLALSRSSSQDDSLGMQLIVSQSMPIRLILGSGLLMINPIPFWINFKIGLSEYHLIKGYNGLYQLFVLPFAFTGLFLTFSRFNKDQEQNTPLKFLSVYFISTIISVAITSMEQRHLAQFFPALIILAAVPDVRKTKIRKLFYRFATMWFFIVFVVHFLWVVLKYT